MACWDQTPIFPGTPQTPDRITSTQSHDSFGCAPEILRQSSRHGSSSRDLLPSSRLRVFLLCKYAITFWILVWVLGEEVRCSFVWKLIEGSYVIFMPNTSKNNSLFLQYESFSVKCLLAYLSPICCTKDVLSNPNNVAYAKLLHLNLLCESRLGVRRRAHRTVDWEGLLSYANLLSSPTACSMKDARTNTYSNTFNIPMTSYVKCKRCDMMYQPKRFLI